MNIKKAKTLIAKLNNPQFGSFGEYVFSHYVVRILKRELVKVHKDGADFIYKRRKVDVGASRNINVQFVYQIIRNKDAFVFFYKDCCFINYPGVFEAKLRWSEVASLFKAWEGDRKIVMKAGSVISYKSEYAAIKNKIASFFNDHGYQTRIIYRTVSGKFGLRESPGNLISKEINHRRILVYLDFNGYRRTSDNINFIIAFPEKYQSKLPLQKRVSIKSGNTNVKKIDLIKIIQTKNKCYFASVDELIKIFFIRYPAI